MQMTKEEQAQSLEQAIESLFKVANFATSSSDAAIKAEMREKQMAYGILLHSCGLIEMTDDAVKNNMEDVKCKLSEASRVRVRLTECIIIGVLVYNIMVAYSILNCVSLLAVT